MLITQSINQKPQSNYFTLCLLFITANFFCLIHANASNLNTEQLTVSHGQLTKSLNSEQRTKIINRIKHTEIPDQLTEKATAKTRNTILNNQKSSVTKASKSYIYQDINNNYDADFEIYSATSLLLDDYDGDGFYQTLSVTFDADIYSYTDNQLGEVYALLYISKNGGPWTHYFTTDNFIIEGDNELDEYEVISTFLSGYTSDYYDVLIDLYQVGFNDVVATYSSNDSNDLYALSLESSDYDEPYTETYIEVIEIHGGSMYALMILLFGIFMFRSNLFRRLI
jgi:hypothetical protein